MLSFIVFFLAFSSAVKADFSETINDINDFFNPAYLEPEVMAKIGELIAKNEWQAHAKKYLESLPLYAEYAWKLQLPLQYALPYLCEPCREVAPSLQAFLKSTGLASIAVDLTVCNAFFATEHPDMVPVCDALLVGLDIYTRYAPTESICSFLPACSAKTSAKRNAPKYTGYYGDDEEEL